LLFLAQDASGFLFLFLFCFHLSFNWNHYLLLRV
jgi:hypothetical protein